VVHTRQRPPFSGALSELAQAGWTLVDIASGFVKTHGFVKVFKIFYVDPSEQGRRVDRQSPSSTRDPVVPVLITTKKHTVVLRIVSESALRGSDWSDETLGRVLSRSQLAGCKLLVLPMSPVA
jgi:hypothetical protein